MSTAQQITKGQLVAVHDARGCWLAKTAESGMEWFGRDAGVLVRWADAEPEDVIGWPAAEVLPIEDAPGPVLSHAEYRERFFVKESE